MYTKGPWEVIREVRPDINATWLWVGPISWNTRVCRVVEYSGEEIEQRANTSLISAAPELLEALEELTKCVYAGYRAGSPKFEDAMLYAAKAIKKAKETS